MSKKTDIYKEILKDYEKIRTHNQNILRENQEYIYKKFPRIADIDREINLTGIKLAKLILLKPNNYIQKSQELKENNEKLKNEKLNILKQNNISEKLLQLSYNCNKCNDIGFIDNKECNCFKQKFIIKAYNSSNLKENLKKENFDFFDFRYYSTEIYKDKNISPRENIQYIMNLCTKFVENFDNLFKNLLLYGNTGLGKTFICNCIAKDLLEAGKIVIYVTAFQLFKLIEEERFNKNDDETISSNYIDDILSVDLLIIDDLGTEFTNAFSSSEFFNIINTRLLNKKSVVISTNLSMEDIIEQYSDRIASRIVGNYIILEFFGDDIRMLKKINK